MSSALSPITRQTVGRTFILAATALGVGALAQMGVVGWLFGSRFRVEAVAESEAARPGGVPSFAAANNFDPLFDAEGEPLARPAAPAQATPAPATPPPKPKPMPAMALRGPETAADERFAETMEQARALRARGDVQVAIVKFREAEAMRHESAEVAAELAATYEKANQPDKAAECWRRVYEMGEAAGVFFSAADGKLKASQAQAMRVADVQNAVAAATGTPAPPAPVVAAPANPAAAALTGKLALGKVARQETPQAGAERKFALTVPVQAKGRTRLDPREVIVQVLFYDAVNGRALERTNAEVTYQWSAPPADWTEEETETLTVSYLQPVRRVADEERKYYGYIVSLYYKNALQDFRSDPPDLAQRAAPPKTLSPDSAP